MNNIEKNCQININELGVSDIKNGLIKGILDTLAEKYIAYEKNLILLKLFDLINNLTIEIYISYFFRISFI